MKISKELLTRIWSFNTSFAYIILKDFTQGALHIVRQGSSILFMNFFSICPHQISRWFFPKYPLKASMTNMFHISCLKEPTYQFLERTIDLGYWF